MTFNLVLKLIRQPLFVLVFSSRLLLSISIMALSPVFACFLDASKAFDLVRHDILFDLLLSRGLPSPVVRLLSSWYSTQNLSFRWGSASSTPFTVSNGVRQGDVLSPVLFSIYLDELLMKLESLGVGCFWNNHFAGALHMLMTSFYWHQVPLPCSFSLLVVNHMAAALDYSSIPSRLNLLIFAWVFLVLILSSLSVVQLFNFLPLSYT